MKYIISKDVSGNDVELAYEDYGTGSPVILIHGWPLSMEMWEYQISDLVSAGHRVITYDRRGFGNSSKPWSGYDYDTLTSDLNSIITQLILRDITLVGFSMGGGEVIRYFSKYKGTHVKKIVLISSVAPLLQKNETNPHGVPQNVFDDMVKEIKEDRIGFLENFGKTFFGVNFINKPISSALLQYYQALASKASAEATIQCIYSFSQTDFAKELDSVDVPTLIIHGDKDQTVPVDCTSSETAKLIAKNEFIIYEGAPHGLWYTHKERLNADLLKFI